MIELYTAATGNGQRPALILEELGLDYTVRKVDLAKGEQRSAEFLRLNPRGQIQPAGLELNPVQDRPGEYQGTFLAILPGRYRIKFTPPQSTEDVSEYVQVDVPDVVEVEELFSAYALVDHAGTRSPGSTVVVEVSPGLSLETAAIGWFAIPCTIVGSTATCPLGTLEGVTNMVVVEGDFVGQTIYRGLGAGAGPTASAIMGDVVDVALTVVTG